MADFSPTTVRALTDYMFVPDSEIRADCTIVLGMTLFRRPVGRVIDLFRRDLSGLIVFSGGYNDKLKSIEANEMKLLWERIFGSHVSVKIEVESTNTRENMENVKRLLQCECLLSGARVVNIVAISYHMRRAIETFKDVFGDDLAVGAANYPSQYCPPQGWADNVRGRELVFSEYEKIKRYLPNRFLASGGPDVF